MIYNLQLTLLSLFLNKNKSSHSTVSLSGGDDFENLLDLLLIAGHRRLLRRDLRHVLDDLRARQQIALGNTAKIIRQLSNACTDLVLDVHELDAEWVQRLLSLALALLVLRLVPGSISIIITPSRHIIMSDNNVLATTMPQNLRMMDG